MSTTDPIRKPEQIKKLCDYFKERNTRDYVLFTMGVCSALRISDMLELTWGDVYDFKNEHFKTHIDLVESKTGKKAKVAINAKLLEALSIYKSESDNPSEERYIFMSQKGENKPIGRIHAYKIIRRASEALDIDGNISCHSLRKTFGYHAFKQGFPLPVIMNVFNHSSVEISKRYLCIDQDDKDDLYLHIFTNI